MTLLDRYTEACNYPGTIDPAAVDVQLKSYLSALGVSRKVVHIESDWWRDLGLMQTVIKVVNGDARDARDALAARAVGDARAALAARDARAARAVGDALAARAARTARAARDARAVGDALAARDKYWPILVREFGNWCMMGAGWYYDWELSWIVTSHLGSVDSMPTVSKWSHPLFEAFCCGAWRLFWTADTLYWFAKPSISIEQGTFGRRLHCEDGPACANAIENLYFIHGVLVPAYAVVRPDKITLKEIESEDNAEVRRILTERFGWERYIRESGAQQTHRRFNERDGQWEQLYQLTDGSKRAVLTDPSTGRRYALGCPREVQSCEDAQNWFSHGLDKLAIHRS